MTHEWIESLTPAQIDDLVVLYQKEWWTKGRRRQEVEAMLAGSDLVLGMAERENGRLIAFARVLTDSLYKALLFDIILAEDYRSKGLGRELMDGLLDHPKIRAVRHKELYCHPDMVPFYTKWGFRDTGPELKLLRRDDG